MNNHTSHPAIEFRDVSLAFDGDMLLDHISFTVFDGTDEQLWAAENTFLRDFVHGDEDLA
jgi:hypothetical protein